MKANCTFVFFLSLILFCSCSGHKKEKYVEHFRERLSTYDSFTAALLSKYAGRLSFNSIDLYPSRSFRYGDGLRYFYDTTIVRFCELNDIDHIEIRNDNPGKTAEKFSVTYFLSNNDYRYVYESEGNNKPEDLENTRVLIVPINKYWTFQYEKPNF